MLRSIAIRLGLAAACAIGIAAWGSARPRTAVAPIATHDNREAAGLLRNGSLSLDLELALGVWHPDAPDGPSMEILAFGERGRPLAIPSPLIRVREGTRVHVRVRNTLSDAPLVVHGLHSRAEGMADSLVVPPGELRTADFVADVPGTYMYWGSTTGTDLENRGGMDSQLGGALVIDPAGGAEPDRVFVLGMWAQFPDSATPDLPPRDIMVINGRSWPHTERLTVAMHDTVSWRWVNATNSSHPMHLHGFFFELASRGDMLRDTAFAPDDRQLMVTELMAPGGTMAMRWAPTQPGNWIFHCHFAFHVSPLASLTGNLALEAAERAAAHGGPAPPAHPHTAEHAMNGLILGLTVPVPDDWPAGTDAVARREIRLLVQSAPRRFGDSAGYGFVIPEGADPPRDSINIPGPPLVLRRNEPVRVTVVNNLDEPTGVHWHGIELESYPDGVPGWSGIGDKVMAPIAPGDSFAAEFTPPRAGTFIYHAHANEMTQMALGLYGALIVTETGAPPDPETDHTVIVGLDGPSFRDSSAGLIDGHVSPPPRIIAAGRPNRLRLINIDTDHRVLFQLQRDTTLIRWRPLAKDGADLAPAHRAARPASLLTGPGETADFEIVAAAGDTLTLVMTGPYSTVPWRRTMLLIAR